MIANRAGTGGTESDLSPQFLHLNYFFVIAMFTTRLSKYLLALFLLITGLAVLVLWSSWRFSIQTPEIYIARGDNATQVAKQLHQQNAFFPHWLFVHYGRLSGSDKNIKPGYYALPRTLSVRQLWHMLKQGQRIHINIIIPEGIRFADMRRIVAQQEGLKHLTTDWNEAQFREAIDPTLTFIEGQFFPDTYKLEKGSSDLAFYQLAHNTLKIHLQNLWQNRPADFANKQIPTVKDWLVLASMVEKETGDPKDRAHIAAVFVNRLKIGMRLQSDPTVIYGMGERFVGNLRKKDLQRATPFNTYTRYGLPPHPICLVGKAALEAVLQPANSRALYFVARGDRTSQFSHTLVEHNHAVNRYQKNPATRVQKKSSVE